MRYKLRVSRYGKFYGYFYFHCYIHNVDASTTDLSIFERFSNSSEISNFMKLCSVGAEPFYADRGTTRS